MIEAIELSPKELVVATAAILGKPLAAAGIEAGYSARTARVSVSKVLQRPHVKQYIKAQKEKLVKRTEISLEKIQEEMASIAYARMFDYISLTENGDPYVDLKKVDHFQSGAISSVEVETYVEGHMDNARDVKRVKFKLHDKQAALMNLAKLCGFITKDASMIDVTPASDSQDLKELARRMVFLLRSGTQAAPTATNTAPVKLTQIEGQATHVEPVESTISSVSPKD